MKFSICIPNYNYADYIGRTIQSVLDQTYPDFEILVSDNCSTDGSAAVVRSFDDPRIKLHQNRCNVGFAGNLDRAARFATGDYLLMLSSDDMMRPDALSTYASLLQALPENRRDTVLCASFDQIDARDQITNTILRPRHDVWRAADRSPQLEAVVAAPVYVASGDELLRRCLPAMQNPLFFVSTAYPRELYEAVEGYCGGRFFGPDKWFHWRLLGAARGAVLVEKPLFAYRWHPGNQTAQQTATGALKYLIDEYAGSFELDAALLARIGIDRGTVERGFIEHDIVRHGLALLADGHRSRAARTYRFGQAAYPHHLRRNTRAWIFRLLTMLGPLGSWIARQIRHRYSDDSGDSR